MAWMEDEYGRYHLTHLQRGETVAKCSVDGHRLMLLSGLKWDDPPHKYRCKACALAQVREG